MVKIKDIAIKCHTSTATVSKALHNSPELSKETIERIKKAANKMGYVPNAYAQALKLKRSFSIGVIFYDSTMGGGLRHEYFSAILESLKVEAESHGYSITFLSRNININMSYLQLAKFRNMDGVIIVSENFSDPQIIELVNSSIPVVTIDYIFSSSTAIMSDNVEGEKTLVEYVARLNHKRIAFVHGEITDVTNKRLAGFYQGMEEMSLPLFAEYVLEARYHDPKASGKATKSLLSLTRLPDCIIYPDDVSLLGGYTALTESGLKVPDDISIVGYDGSELSRIFRPMMTTYVQDSEELGKEAASLLIKQIEEPKTFAVIPHFIKGHIQIGNTTKER